MYSPLGLVIFVSVEGTFVCFTDGHDHFISNTIGSSKLSCYCAKPKLVTIGTATSKTATRADTNNDIQNGNTRNGECRLGSLKPIGEIEMIARMRSK